MPLLIEDGTGIAGANSYASIDDLRAYCLDRGVTFPVTGDPDPATAVFTPFLIRACDYIESRRDWFAGILAFPLTQTLCFPRNDIFLGYSPAGPVQLPVIPLQLVKAQCQLVVEQLNGVALFPSLAGVASTEDIPVGPSGAIAIADGRVIIREKLDVIETQYSDTRGTQTIPIMPAVEALLNVLFLNHGRFMTTVRL